jgi:hypothetical protein
MLRIAFPEGYSLRMADRISPWSPGQPSMRYRIIVGFWLVLFVSLLLGAYNGWRILGDYDKPVAIAFAVIGYLLVVRFRSLGSIRCPWTVAIADDAILTSDGQSDPHQLPIADLRRVIVATDDSGPWGDDVLFYLFSDAIEPVGVFPLEAAGCQDFLGWLSQLPGYRDRELAMAMGSTEIAKFEIFNADNHGP